MFQNLLAGLGLLVCALLLLRMALPAAQQHRFDAFWRGLGQRLQGLGQRVSQSARQRWQQLRSGRDARREAADAIERARHGKPTVQRDGNVIRPDSFNKPGSKKPPLH
jgi:hypothetical protein